MGWFSRKPQPIDQWRRQPGEIAIRVEGGDVQRDGGNRPFVVYDGTLALVFQQGRLIGRLASGKHDLDGSLRSWLVGDNPTVLVITDDGDISLNVDVTSLYSSENVSLNVRLRLTLALRQPEMFYLNVMKDRKHYLEDDLRTHLRSELFEGLLSFTSTHPIDHLYHNPALRSEAEGVLRNRVGSSLTRLGLALVSVNVTAVTSSDFDAHRGRQAGVEMQGRDVDLEALRLDVLKKAREHLAASIHHREATKADLLDAVHQATHDLELKDRLREDELARLNARLEQDALDFEQQRMQERETGKAEHELQLDDTRLDAFLGRRIKEAQTHEQERDFERLGDEKDWDLARKMRDDALAARKRMKQDDVEILSERAGAVGKMDTATKVALGLGDTDALLELERLERQQQMSPDQLLILAAEKSPAVAEALAERFKSEGRLNDQVMDQLRRQIEVERQTSQEHASRLERVLNQSLQQMGKVATARAESQGPGDQTIVAGGGQGPPTIINPKRPAGGEQADDTQGGSKENN